MQLSVAPAVELELEIVQEEGRPADEAIAYKVTGPERVLDMLKDACSKDENNVSLQELDDDLYVHGPLSPLQSCSVEGDSGEAAGCPPEAKFFSFAYPGQFAWRTKEEGMPARGAPEWTSLEKKLEALNLADEKWGYFMLVGGFIYFDADKKLIQANALTLVPSHYSLVFQGPYEPSRACIEALRERHRMIDVTLDALEEAGFKAFGWVNPAEAPAGARLGAGKDEEVAEPTPTPTPTPTPDACPHAYPHAYPHVHGTFV